MDVFARDSGFISGCPAYGPDPVSRPPAMALEHPGSAASHALPNPELDTVASEACRRLARSPATKSSLSAACCTTAAAILQKVLHILPSIVVGNFVTWLDSAQCHDHDTALASHRFC